MNGPDADYKLIVGLGNPGPRYRETRHNVGFMVVDALFARHSAGGPSKWQERGDRELAEITLAGQRLYLLKPLRFMNRSGEVVREVAGFYKFLPGQLIAVHDELDLPLSALRLKRGGGDGGHNGLRSMTTQLGSNDYTRVRVGIGRPPGQFPNGEGPEMADWVLSPFIGAERDDVSRAIDAALNAIEMLVREGLSRAQNVFN